MKKSTIIILIIILFIIFGIAGATIYYINMMGPVSSTSETVNVEIEKGATATKIGNILHQNDLIKNEFIFKVYIKLNQVNDMQAGEYELNKNMGISQIVDILEKGPDSSKSTIDITFLEGKNIRWIAKTIAENTNNTEDDVYAKLQEEEYLDSIIEKYWFITDDIKNENIYYSLEGYLFPDTYNFKSKDVDVETILNSMLDQMEKKLETYKEEIQKAQVSVHKLLSVASIIELEASNPLDRSGVASVIYNRMQKNMSIGSDVTTYYSIKVDMSERDLYQSELNSSNPYNTRGPNMEGKLPIGPICSVGLESINAALHPDTTDYLYFVADSTGKIYFARNQAEHNANISNLQAQGLWYAYD